MLGKWILPLAGAVLLAGAVAGVMLLRHLGAEPAAPPTAPVAAPAAGEIALTGKIRAQQVIDVAPAVDGTIEEFFVEVGQEVFEGQLLARISNDRLETEQEAARRDVEATQNRVNALESDIIKARLEASRARADASRSQDEFERAQKAYERQQMLYREGATPRLVFEKAEREFETAKKEHRTLEDLAAQSEQRVAELVKRLDNDKRTLEDKIAELESAKAESGAADIVSPAQGIVVALNGEPGQEIAQDRHDFIQIGVQLGTLEVALDPDPPTLRRIRIGAPALVSLPEIGGDGMPGTVKALQGGQAVVEFTSANPAVKPGMSAQVRIKTEGNN